MPTSEPAPTPSADLLTPELPLRDPAVGRRIAIAAFAFVACVAPAACDYAAASTVVRPTSSAGAAAGHSGQHGGQRGSHSGHSTGTTSSAVVPADDTTGDSTETPDPPEDPTNGADPTESADATADPTADPTVGASAAPTSGATAAANPPANNGLDVLGRDCSTSKLQPHTGFQIAPACVSTAFGEVAAEDKDPELLITRFPKEVAADAPFAISVSTRNLVRDRFLGAAAGGYYLESSFLDPNGLQRGHFHTACRMLPSLDEAPESAPVPAFFVATQDGGGGRKPDTVTVNVTGLPKGEAQCTVWAGDGSHRIPMMRRANQTPAVDSVRITVG
ncbi:MAG: hypothetical protein QOG20_1506 [Pseudonocardiales bacterium]|nr:hypothetical protein [Pseudonocardiales bacterium]